MKNCSYIQKMKKNRFSPIYKWKEKWIYPNYMNIFLKNYFIFFLFLIYKFLFIYFLLSFCFLFFVLFHFSFLSHIFRWLCGIWEFWRNIRGKLNFEGCLLLLELLNLKASWSFWLVYHKKCVKNVLGHLKKIINYFLMN